MEVVVLFDGVCNLCNGAVQFIIKRDPKGHFKFASLQSEVGQKIISHYQINSEIDSIVVIENKKVYIKSSAAIRIGRKLNGLWKLSAILMTLPPIFRNFLYDIV